MQKLLLVSFVLVTLCSCYRMPHEDEYSLVPTVNNPSVTCDKNDCPLPQIGY